MKNLMEQTPFNYIAIPKTIDNDVPLTSLSIGYETALTIATEALDRLHTTAASHDRIMILEVMGRDAGHIALNAGIAGGADIILVPEIPYTLEGILDALNGVKNQGRDHALIIVSESVPMPAGDTKTIEYPDHRVRYGGIAHALGELIARATKREVRTQHLGHMQRGGSPCARDRILGTLFGYHAATLALKGQFNRMVIWNDARVSDVAIESVFGKENIISPQDPLIHAAQALGIYVGRIPK
jgi:6-phosphofructokinase 1